MKKSYLKYAFIALTIGVLTSCGSTKQKSITKVNHETEITIPCGDQFTDKNFFRGQGMGQSKDLNTAREKARMNANQELATSIGVLSKRVAEKYVNDAGQNPADYNETFQSMTSEVVKQHISNVRVSCNRTTQTSDGMYRVYMAVEAGRDEVFNALDRQAAANNKIKTLYDREKFREVYNTEMENYAKEYGR